MRHDALLLALLAAMPVSAQTLADRVAAASQPRVQFTFAARAGVCGNGRSFIQTASNEFYGAWNDAERRDACVPGPVRVVLDRADRQVVSLAVYVGPVPDRASDVADLGAVKAKDASDYLLGIAQMAQGRVSRDAIFPAALADSVDVGPQLLSIARNQDAARETRRTALAWLSRGSDDRPRDVKPLVTALLAIARDADDNQAVRQQALRSLARLEHGAGVPALMDLARDMGNAWIAREAMASLNASGDPRARTFLRDVLSRTDLPDDVLAAAIRGLGGDYATGADVKGIRAAYAKLPGERSREAALSAIATFGGSENVDWLLALARNSDEPVNARRRAVQHAYHGGATVAELAKVYDETTDSRLKEAIISTLAESGDKQATDKLMRIARDDEDRTARRMAISALGRSSDERVKEFLAQLVQR